ncbi:MAG: hypothetical protein P4L69_18140 [Desulfosporosinus sp.]|nr:hypothetical protein [Desulfosporosinus sp.]
MAFFYYHSRWGKKFELDFIDQKSYKVEVIMSDTKAVIIFIVLSAVLITGIGLLPKSVPLEPGTTTAAATVSNVVHVTQTSDQVPVK